jgi:ABC-type uncharacterized transport system substrate-binding protein
MTSQYKVRVLSSYIFEDGSAAYGQMGRRNRWVNGFVTALVRQRSGLREFDMQFERTPRTQDELEQILQNWRREGVQLAICPGTDSAVRLAALNRSIPMLYFGAHPENNGVELIDQPNVAGIRLNLPLIWSYADNFALLKALMPNLERVYFALNLNSEFAFPNVRVLYRAYKAQRRGFWIPGESPYIGYRSVTFLAERAGLQYLEGPYDSADELEQGLKEADLRNAALVGFNDTVLNEQATRLLLQHCEAQRVPLVWVNNPGVIERHGIADFSSDFEAVGRRVGELALGILRKDLSTEQLPLQEDPGERRTLNAKRARQLGIEVPGQLYGRFTEVIQ